MLNKIQKVHESDTTDDDSSNAAKYILFKNTRCYFITILSGVPSTSFMAVAE